MSTAHYIFALDAHGRVVSCNRIHPEYTPESVVGKPFEEHLAHRCRPCLREGLARVRAGLTADLCLLWRNPEGMRSLDTTLSPMTGCAGILAICAASVRPLAVCRKGFTSETSLEDLRPRPDPEQSQG